MRILLLTPQDFSFLEAIQAHGWPHLLPFSWLGETATVERIKRLENGRVVLLTLRSEGDAISIDVSVEADESEVIGKVRRMFQLDLSLDAFHAFCAMHPGLDHIPAHRQGRMLCSPTVWEDVCKVILTTNTTWTQTRSMVRRMVDAYGSPWPVDPSRHAFPTPEQIAAVPTEAFAAAARLGYRAGSIHALATDLTAGRLDLESLRDPDLPASELWKRLLALRGVGPYAAACLMIYLGRPERVNVDSWARMLLSKELGRAVTDAEVHAFFKPYGPWRGLVYHFYPWKGSRE